MKISVLRVVSLDAIHLIFLFFLIAYGTNANAAVPKNLQTNSAPRWAQGNQVTLAKGHLIAHPGKKIECRA